MNVASVAVPTVTHAPVSTAGLAEKVSIRNLDFYYGTSKALKSISLPLYKNRVTAFIVTRVAYRAARAGMITGVLLAVARISGETAPLLFTALNNQFWSLNLNAPMASLPAVIFQFALSPYKDWQKLAWTGALIITATVLILSIVARALTASRKES